METSASSSGLAPARGELPPPREAAGSPRAAPAARKEQRRHSMGERIREKSFRRGGGSTDHSSKYLARKFSSRDFAPRKGSVDLARAGGRPLDSPSFKSKEPTTPRRGSLDARGGADRRSHRRSTCTCSDADEEEVRSASPTKRAEAELPRFSTIIWEDTAAEQKSALYSCTVKPLTPWKECVYPGCPGFTLGRPSGPASRVGGHVVVDFEASSV